MKLVRPFMNFFKNAFTVDKEHRKALKEIHTRAASLHDTVQMLALGIKEDRRVKVRHK